MARAYRPRRDTITPTEALRLIVDEHLADQPGRTPMRPVWDALSTAAQLETVAAAADPEHGILPWQTWTVGTVRDDALVGAVRNTLLGHAGHLITEQPA